MIFKLFLLFLTCQIMVATSNPLPEDNLAAIPPDSENEILETPVDMSKDALSVEDLEPEGESDETLHTASNIVFRPLFAYRQKLAKRKRLNEAKRRHSKKPTSYPYGYPSYGYPYYFPSNYRSNYQFPAIL